MISGSAKEVAPKIGIIGAGFISQVAHIPHFASNPNCQLLALAELRPILRRKVCERWGIARAYHSHAELLADPDIQAVVIVVRRHHTAKIAMEALKANKHVFSEKPMAQTAEVARQLVNEANSRNLIYSIGFMRRYDQAVIAAKQRLEQLIAKSAFGEIKHVKASLVAGGDYCGIGGEIKSREPKPLHIDMPIAPSFVSPDLERAYEHFVNVAGHTINLLRYLFPDIRPHVPFVTYNPAATSLAVLTEEPFPITFDWSDAPNYRPWEETVEIQFERGSVKLDLVPAFLRHQSSSLKVSSYPKSGRSSENNIKFDWGWAFENEDLAFVNAIATNTHTPTSGAKCVDDFAVIDKIWHEICSSLVHKV